MVPAAIRPSKPTAPAVVRNIDIYAGLYKVLSTNGTDWYLVDVRRGTCSCPCGQNAFRNAKAGMCRHLVAAKITAKAWHDMRSPNGSQNTGTPPAARRDAAADFVACYA